MTFPKKKKGSFLHSFRVKKKIPDCHFNQTRIINILIYEIIRSRLNRLAWGQPDGPWVDKKINILTNIIAFHRGNDLKLKFIRENNVDILTKEVNAKKKFESKPTFWDTQ